jgi:hypothetical protein
MLATLATPYTWRLYVSVLELPTQAGVFNLIAELRALSFRGGWEWVVLALTGMAAFTLGRRPKLASFEILLLVSSAVFSFRAQRDLWLVVFAATAILVTGRRSPERLVDQMRPTFWRVVFVGAMTAVIIAVTIHERQLTEARLEERIEENYPAKAAQFVEERGFAGPLYNHYNWGGYLMWRLPQYPVAMDGRTIVHGAERIVRSINTWEGPDGWDSDPELNEARLVIAQTRTPLTSHLRLDSRFEVVYNDRVAVVFVAREGASTPAASKP